MRKFSHGTVAAAAAIFTLLSSGFAVVAAVDSNNGRSTPAADRTEPAVSNSTSVAPPGGSNASVVEVAISGFAFGPPALEVSVGSTISWTNRDNVAHTVSTSDGLLASADLDNGDTYSVVVDEPGTIQYYCDIHQYMHGTITVTP